MLPFGTNSHSRRIPKEITDEVLPVFAVLGVALVLVGLAELALGDFGGILLLLTAFFLAAVVEERLAPCATIAMTLSAIALVDGFASTLAVCVPVQMSWSKIPEKVRPLAVCYMLATLYGAVSLMWTIKLSYKYDMLPFNEDLPIVGQALSPITAAECAATSGVTPFTGPGYTIGEDDSVDQSPPQHYQPKKIVM